MNCSPPPRWILRWPAAGWMSRTSTLAPGSRPSASNHDSRPPSCSAERTISPASPVCRSARQTSSRLSSRSCCGGDRPAVRAPLRIPELRVQPLDHVVRERRADARRVLVRLRGVVAQQVGQEALDDPVAPDHAARPAAVPAAVRTSARPVPFSSSPSAVSRLSISPTAVRDTPERIRDPRRDRRRRLRRLVHPDGGDEQVDRLQVVVDRVSVRLAHPAQS